MKRLRICAGEGTDRVYIQATLTHGLAPTQVGQLYDGSSFVHVGTQALQQLGSGDHGAAGRDQVVDQQYALAGAHGIGVHFHRCIAIFQGVIFCHRTVGQFALLAHRHKAQVQLIGQYRAQNKAARIDARYKVQTLTHVAIHEHINQNTEGTRVLQNRSDVAESDARLGPVRHAANRVTDVDGGIDMHGSGRL